MLLTTNPADLCKGTAWYYARYREGYPAPLIARSSFQQVESYILRYRHGTDIDRIIGHLYSTSFCSPAVLGERRAGFERDLRQTLAAIIPRGQFAG